MKKATILFYLVFAWILMSKTVIAETIPETLPPNAKLTVKQDASGNYKVEISNGDLNIYSHPEGLWAIANDWIDDQPDHWIHVQPSEVSEAGDWTILSGQTNLKDGTLSFRDSYRYEHGMIKCVRRFEYKGTETLERVTLSAKWIVPGERQQAFLPGTVYYGNPSGEKNTPDNVPVYHGRAGEFAIFEEHRYPMPFATLERNDGKGAAALHTIPSRVPRGKNQDQWWSMGVRAFEEHSELILMSGPIGYNGKHNIAKALQRGWMKYPEATMEIQPDTVIEKTFYLDCWQINSRGRCFQRPVEKSIELFKPFFADDFPEFKTIIKDKFRLAKSRWIEGENYAGFNMYPAPTFNIVMGWCGQAAAPGFALQKLMPILAENKEEENQILQMIQKSLDHLTSSPFNENGFAVLYDVEKGTWGVFDDYVSMGQAMHNIANAVKSGRTIEKLDTHKWEAFLKKAVDVQSQRILNDDWFPRSTAEGFLIAPLVTASRLFDNEEYWRAALKAADHYIDRHLSMEEPYWGGTLDAQCEDKEGAVAAFQGFLAVYEVNGEEKYLDAAKHACDVFLSYLNVWDIQLPPGRLADHGFKTRGWTAVSVQNQHLDVYGVLLTPELVRLSRALNHPAYAKLAAVMYRSCGQLIDPYGSQGEQIQQTNFAQRGDMSDVLKLRGGYSELWTVFWITAHFLNAAAQLEDLESISD